MTESPAATESFSEPVPPTLEQLFRLVLQTGEPSSLGETPVGVQSVAPITGGVLSGPGVDAVVRGAGTDHVCLRSDGSAVYTVDLLADVETEDASGMLRLSLTGIRFGSSEVMDALDRGDQVDPALYYFRGTLEVSTSVRSLTYLNRAVVVTSGSRHGNRVVVDAFLVT